ncbi:MAG TPA: hypothetical protein VJG32_17955 [Anaerolineae bacterium]|nr:hypothetical protein [Anaerolineae bacterium]
MGSEFTELLESFTAEQASIQNLFNQERDGIGIRALVRSRGPKYVEQLSEAAKFIGSVFDGRRPMWHLREALTTSDFPLLFGDTIDRMLLAKYKAVTPDWQQYMRVTRTIRDFRAVKRFRCTSGAGMTDEVGIEGHYEADSVSEQSYQFTVGKYGRVRNIAWEALVNDDLDALQSTPDDLARQAINRDAHFATGLFVVNTTLYAVDHTAENGSTYSNKGTATFSAPALAAAISDMGDFPGDDEAGTPIMNDPLYIVVGTREMEMKVNQVLSSLVVTYTGAAEAGNLPMTSIIPAELRNKMKCVYNPFIRMRDPDTYKTSWYLFADPGDGWAVEIGYLNGHDSPELYMKLANQIRLGGGAAIEGDFDTDARSYKMLHVIGGNHTNAVGGWRFTWMSDGTEEG